MSLPLAVSTLAELEKLGEEPFTEHPAAADTKRLYAIFSFLLDDDNWLALKKSQKKLDRHALATRLWQHLESGDHRALIEQTYQSLEYHRRLLFDWLLGRYDLRRARRAVGKAGWAPSAHLFLCTAMLAAFALHHANALSRHPTLWAVVLCVAVYGFVTAALTADFRAKLGSVPEALAVALHSLVPRLAGAGAVGLVILASSEELLRVVVGTRPSWLLGLLLAGYAYLLLEMARRIHPFPPPRRLLLLGLDVAATALAHALALALLAEGSLRKVLAGGEGSHGPFTCWQSAAVAVFIFTIGLVVNLIWAEKPVTEPL